MRRAAVRGEAWRCGGRLRRGEGPGRVATGRAAERCVAAGSEGRQLRRVAERCVAPGRAAKRWATAAAESAAVRSVAERSDGYRSEAMELGLGDGGDNAENTHDGVRSIGRGPRVV